MGESVGDVNTQEHGVCFLDVRKNDAERLRVHLREYKGRMYVDCRVWFLAPDGSCKPSSKGLMLKPSDIPSLARAMSDAAAANDPKGVI
ncbi:hypothetical protein EIL82_03805 [Pandoraea apista]|nr:hypothetical protein EIB05_03720 [Pandoraea apista]RRJ81536.1 hypothetical protein EIL82_03805 [Pandoraea apista]RSD08236.1 hypothetical protein EIZ52_24720 [Pandoraea apista]RSD16723.1 hypothetical protein EJB12_05200 [Pandoraea apista]RSK87611.1 hypothetical protein EJE96_02010 [Pandoraea apista]